MEHGKIAVIDQESVEATCETNSAERAEIRGEVEEVFTLDQLRELREHTEIGEVTIRHDVVHLDIDDPSDHGFGDP